MKDTYIVGRNPVIEALKAEKEIDKIFILKGERQGSIKKIIGMAKEKNIIIQEVDKVKLDNIAQGNAHQGVALLSTGYTYFDLEDILKDAKEKNEDPFIIILDEIEDPHNLGAVVRTAECAGVHGIIIPKRRAAAVNATVYKSSAGAVEHIKIAQVTNISNTITELKEKGLWIYGADIKGEANYYQSNLNGPIALVIGNEGKGISRLVKEKCDVLVNIPMKGSINSLNASASAAILIYEVLKQRNEEKK